jgi:hypothetical protein
MNAAAPRTPEDAAAETVEVITRVLSVIALWVATIGRYLFALLLIIGHRTVTLLGDPTMRAIMHRLFGHGSDFFARIFLSIRRQLSKYTLFF